MIAVALLASLSVSAAAASDDAVSAEDAAFAAVEEERWCDAARHFSRAHKLAPSGTLLENAAEAAISAGDHAWAAELLRAAATLAPRSRRSGLRQRANASKTQATTQHCPRIVAPDEDAALKADARAATERPASPPSADEAPRVDEEATTSSTPPPETAATGSSMPLVLGGVGAVAILAGAAVLAGGGAASGAAALPWMAFANAQEEIRQAQSEGADAATAQQTQAESRAQWESWGAPLAVIGPALLGVGAAGLVVGAAAVAGALVLGAGETE